MFELVLVDDKKDIVNGIKSGVDWKQKNVNVTCFYNGRDAKEFILKNEPDLVITDICMPFINGIDLIKETTDLVKKTKFVILTGYNEFTYAKDALRLGVCEYLSKPVTIEEIEKLVDEEIEIKQREYAKDRQIVNKQIQYYKNIPVLKNQWFDKVVKQEKFLSNEHMLDELFYLNVNLSYTSFLLVAVSLDETTEDDDLTLYAIENIGREIIQTNWVCEPFRRENCVFFLIECDPNSSNVLVYYDVFKLIQEIQKLIYENFQVTISSGVSNIHGYITDLVQAYQESCDALDYNFYKGNNSVTLFLDLNDYKKEVDKSDNYEKQKNIVKQLKHIDVDEATTLFQDYFNSFFAEKKLQPYIVRELLTEFLLKLCGEFMVDEKVYILSILNEFAEIKNLEQIQEWFLAFIHDIILKNNGKNLNSREEIIKVKNYIDENYATSITLKKMADSIYISQSYLSFMFKEVVGVNFNEYLTNVRMENAKRLLKSSDYKVYEICEMVGYTDKKYFSNLFKKNVGTLPKEWAMKNKTNKEQ